jgi:uncharacterized membrane protein
MKTVIEILSLLLVGWIAGAELGSWCCVQPVVARLPYEYYVAAEQAMLRTFGRIMPVLMPLSGVLAILLVVLSRGERTVVLWLRVAAALCIAVTVVTTLTVNVPINTRTASWELAKRLFRMAADARAMVLVPRGTRMALRVGIRAPNNSVGCQSPLKDGPSEQLKFV